MSFSSPPWNSFRHISVMSTEKCNCHTGHFAVTQIVLRLQWKVKCHFCWKVFYYLFLSYQRTYIFLYIKLLDELISQIYFLMKFYMFWAVRLSIIRSLFTVHSAVVYVIQVCRQLSSRNRIFHPGPARNLSIDLYDIPLPSVQWINSWWWTEEVPETCRLSW
jgi:hypothetical protein